MTTMTEADQAEQGREPEEPAAGTQGTGDGAEDDGFPGEDVAPEESDPDLDVNDPFSVGDDREPLEAGSGDEAGSDGDDHLED